MPNYRLSNKAVEDLHGIVIYGLETHGEIQTDHYLEYLYKVLELAAQFPDLGRPYKGRQEQCLHYQGRYHDFFYEKEGDGILVLRILRNNMDFKRHI